MNKKCWKFARFVAVKRYGKRVSSKENKGIDAKIVTECGLKYSDYCIRRDADFKELLEL